MATRLPNDSPNEVQVPREGTLQAVSRGALVVAGLALTLALLVGYGWMMALVANHVGGVTAGLLLVVMGALAVAALSGGAWSLLQHPAIRRRYR